MALTDDDIRTIPGPADLDSYPDPVEPCDRAEQARQRRKRELLRVAWIGITLRMAVIAMELAGVWFLGYAVLLVDAVASVFDVVASLAIVLAIRLAARPPDDDHPFGHGRYEPLAGLQLGIMVSAAGLWMAVRHLWGAVASAPAGDVAAWAWTIPAVAAVTLEVSARMVRRSGRRQQSTALIAEGLHYRVDATTSCVAAVGLAVAGQLPEFGHRIDLLSAALLAIIMVGLGAQAAWENLHQILDRAPRDDHFERVRVSAMKVEGVHDVEKVRIQHAGPDAHVDIDIEVDPEMPVAEAHVITQHVRAQIQTDWPFVREVVVHVEPYYAGDH
jgi:cation diffusion facilitator family transporter